VAKEIKQLLERSVDKEDAGGLLAQAAGMPRRSMQQV
jgi:hypothetical protein